MFKLLFVTIDGAKIVIISETTKRFSKKLAVQYKTLTFIYKKRWDLSPTSLIYYSFSCYNSYKSFADFLVLSYHPATKALCGLPPFLHTHGVHHR